MYIAIKPKTWDETRHLISQLPGQWVFRGQSKESWGLSTTLERELLSDEHPENKEIIQKKEQRILWEFKRRAHHYLASVPEGAQHIEWLSLIQHYGGVTRLLDFSYSFYVATFFAMEEYNQNEDAVVWAIHLDNVDKVFRAKFAIEEGLIATEDVCRKYSDLANSLIWKEDNDSLVFPVEPIRMNERMAIQQGLFLFPLNPREGFESNLAAVFNEEKSTFKQKAVADYDPEIHTRESLEAIFVIKLTFQDYLRDQILNDLWKMNVNAATLFPGIDGFARSLRYHLL
ncbi:MAG: FRG domain-containing protein [Dehalococcoidales bacterium]|nr:FRG domain-containing protein [Dehalococcoidales bacterium]